MEDIKFSIIIPMYNVEFYIENCIKSILEQDYLNFEIIIVDDGSKDNSYNLVAAIKSNKIMIIKKENGGLSSARNAGISHVTGDYIWFVDGDDYIEENALQKLYEKLKQDDYDVVCCNYYKDYGKSKVLMRDNINWEDIKQKTLINTSACTKIIKTAFYKKNNFKFPEGKIYEDLALIPYVLAKSCKAGLIETPLYNYVYREGSIMNKKEFRINRDDKFLAIDNLYNSFINDKLDSKYKDELEFLTIKHLLIVYSTEIIRYGEKIYKERFLKVINYLNNKNINWSKNKYLRKASFLTRIYVWMFKNKMFGLCKLALVFKKL